MFGNIPPFQPNGYWPGGTVPNASTFNAAVTMKETLTINKTAEATSESFLNMYLSDVSTSTGFIKFLSNSSGTSFAPMLDAAATSTNIGFLLRGQVGTDSGSLPVLYFASRNINTAPITTRPLFGFYNNTTEVLSGLPLNSGANLALSWGTQSTGSPTFTSRSAGTRLVLYANLSGSAVDNAIGVDSSSHWVSIPQATSGSKWRIFGGTTDIFSVRGDGRLTTTGGRVVKTRTALTTPVTVADGTDYLVRCKLTVPAAVAVSIPGATAAGTVFEIKDATGDAAANNITITPTSGTIDGAATLVINTNFGKARLISDGTNYDVL